MSEKIKQSNNRHNHLISHGVEMLHITQIISLLCKAAECPLHFDTKREGIG